MSASQLLSPFTLGSLKLANRVVMAPLTRGRAGVSRVANEHMAQYYGMRASAGLIISEATAVSAQGYGWYGAPALYTDAQAEGWRLSTEAVHGRGGAIFAQLWHMGRQAHSSFREGEQVVAPSAIAIAAGTVRDANQRSVPYETPRALETHEIVGVVEDFKRSAELAKRAGFDGVELHGANGYLLDTFLQSVSNQRTDRYGGSAANRARFLLEVLEAVKEVFPADRVGVKVSPNGAFGGMGSADNVETFTHLAQELSAHGLAYLHVMDGLGFGFHKKCRPVTLFEMKSRFQGNVIGNVTYTKHTAEGALRTGSVDLVAFGRAYISNPDLVERFKNDWPLTKDAPLDAWYGRKPDPKDCLQGYLTYGPYQPATTN